MITCRAVDSVKSPEIGRSGLSVGGFTGRLAMVLFGLFLLILGATGVMILIAPAPPPGVAPITADAVVFSVGLIVMAAVGALVAGRHPDNPVGWLLGAFCLIQVLAPSTYLYAIIALAGNGEPLPWGAQAAWLTSWIWIPAIGILALALLHFPDGRLPSSAWRFARWLAIGGLIASVALGVALWPERGIELLAMGDDFPGVAGVIATLALVLTFLSFVVGATSLIARFRRSRGEVRLQLKWLMFASGVAAFSLIGLALADIALESDPIWVDVLSTLGFVGIAVAIGVAIFKYRLYAIDLIISRTVTYALLTGLMLTVYTGSTLVLGSVLQPVVGSNALSVAASTLLSAALFSPARRRIQSRVDRRFNRARYDAEMMAHAFGARLIHESDLEILRADLAETVVQALHPSHLALWVRE